MRRSPTALCHNAMILAVILLGACASEPEFDEQYETLSSDIETRAADIEKQLDQPELGQQPDPAIRNNAAQPYQKSPVQKPPDQ